MGDLLTMNVRGHAGGDAQETAFGDDGKTLVKFSLACSFGKDEKKKTSWVNVSCFNDVPKGQAIHIKKGAYVMVQGVPSTYAYLSKNTQRPVASQGLNANDVFILDWHKREGVDSPDPTDTRSDAPTATANDKGSIDFPSPATPGGGRF